MICIHFNFIKVRISFIIIPCIIIIFSSSSRDIFILARFFVFLPFYLPTSASTLLLKISGWDLHHHFELIPR